MIDASTSPYWATSAGLSLSASVFNNEIQLPQIAAGLLYTILSYWPRDHNSYLSIDLVDPQMYMVYICVFVCFNLEWLSFSDWWNWSSMGVSNKQGNTVTLIRILTYTSKIMALVVFPCSFHVATKEKENPSTHFSWFLINGHACFCQRHGIIRQLRVSNKGA